MIKKNQRLMLFLCAALIGTFKPTSNAFADSPGHIIVFKKHVDVNKEARKLSKSLGIKANKAFKHALKGIYVKKDLSQGLLKALAKNPNIAYVEKNGTVKKIAQTTPFGIDRADAEKVVSIDGVDDAVDIDVAILDTGISSTHPDLRINREMSVAVIDTRSGPPRNRGISFSSAESDWTDRDGHGTHVSGTVAAIDNAGGVVGVAPGARVSAVKVLNDDGSGSYAQVIAGIDYVTANASTFSVANMSLGGPTSQALNDAVKNAVNAGVVMVVAAGNEAQNASLSSPASEPSAITVSALADSDGKPAGLGQDSSFGPDDTLASFSNFGSVVDIAAPGVDIRSTFLNGGYATYSGTSMASPHVAGAVALYIAANGRDLNDDGVVDGQDSALVSDALKNSGWKDGDVEYFSGDNDGFSEPLLNVAALLGTSLDQKPTVTITSPSNNATVQGTVTITADAVDDSSVTQVEFFIDGESLGVDATPADGFAISWNTVVFQDGNLQISAVATDDALQTGTSQIMVNVDNVDSAPVAVAGSDQVVQDTDGDGEETVFLDGSGSFDDKAIASYEWYVDSQLVATGSTANVALTVGVHTVTLLLTDSIGQTGSDSLVVTVEEQSESGSISTVQAITFNSFGGKQANKHFEAFANVSDNSQTSLSGAVVTSDLYRNGVKVFSSNSTTDSTGTALLVSAKDAGPGCYEIVITSVTFGSLVWDGQTPVNQYCK